MERRPLEMPLPPAPDSRWRRVPLWKVLLRPATAVLLGLALTAYSEAAEPSGTQGDRSSRFDQRAPLVQKRLDALRDSIGFPGATVSIVLENGAAFDFVTGLADLEQRRSLALGDRMLSGSVGKSLAAAITLQVAEQGGLDLAAPVARYLGREPWFRRLPNAGAVTVEMLLGHTSGIPDHLGHGNCLETLRRAPLRNWSSEELIACALDERPVASPGARFHYADVNYILLGVILERVSGQSYDELLRKLLAREGLMQSEPSNRPRLPGLAVGYSANLGKLGLDSLATEVEIEGRRQRRVVSEGAYVFNPQIEGAAGGLVTTAHDLARWAHRLYGGQVLAPEPLERMLAPGRKRGLSGRGYGLGVETRHSGYWGEAYGHSGWMPGYHSVMEYFPELRVAIAVQVNTDDGSLIHPRRIVHEILVVLAPPGE